MEHVVFFPAPDGAPVFRRVNSLEEAVRLVEHLRNVEGIGEVAVHPLGAEVPLSFRAWYRVEVPGAAPADASAPVEDLAEALVDAPVDAQVDVVPAVELEPLPELVPVEAVTAEPEPVVPHQVEPAAEPVPVAASNGHAPEGVRSLGFFA